jgi:hypothetical protein
MRQWCFWQVLKFSHCRAFFVNVNQSGDDLLLTLGFFQNSESAYTTRRIMIFIKLLKGYPATIVELDRLNQRTTPEGADQLAEWLGRHQFSSSVIDIRAIPSLLHLKTGLSWLGGRRLLAAGAIAGHRALSGWEIVRVPEGEDYAANCIRVNDALLVARGFPATCAMLSDLGYTLVPLDISEYRKMDGGLSCLSLRW